LVRMKRQQEAKRYLELHEKLRDKVPSISIQNPALEGGKYGAIIVPIRAAVQPPTAPPEISWDDVTTKLGLKPSRETGGVMVISSQILTAVTKWAPSVAIGDYDGDGRADIYIVYPWTSNRLFHQNADGAFSDVTDKASVAGPVAVMGGTASAVFADYDNSGHPSLFLAGAGGVKLYKNHGDGTFSDETVKAGLKMPAGVVASQALLFDADNDGFLDLVVTVYGVYDDAHPEGMPTASCFFRNDGDGTFTDATASSGLASAKGRMRGAMFADFNNDGYADLVFFRDDGPPFLFLNRGEDKFVERTREAGSALSGAEALDGRAVDFNHDGNFDVALWMRDGYSVLINDGNAHFTPVRNPPPITVPAGLFDPRGAVADLDGDGFDDLLNLDANGKLHFFRNAGGRFTDAPSGLAGAASQAALVRVEAAPLEGPAKPDLVGFTRAGELVVFKGS